MTQPNNINALRKLSTLIDFARLINSNLDIKFVINNLLLTCLTKFHTTKAIIFFVDENNLLSFKAAKGITKNFLNHFKPFPLKDYDSCKEFKDFLEQTKLELCEKLTVSDKLLGFIFIGKKLTNENYSDEDKEFFKTLVGIGSIAIDNCMSVDRIKNINRNLDNKINQLSSLFDLSKEFSSILEKKRVGKTLVFSLLGQLMISKYAIVLLDKDTAEILETNIQKCKVEEAIKNYNLKSITSVLQKNELILNYEELAILGIELIVPMKIKQDTKGLICLGKRIAKEEYTESDIEFIYSVGSLAIISIENSNLFKETLEKQKIEKDLEIASNIQKNLLPQKLPKMNNFEIAAINQSARQVGGDYYDLVKIDDERLIVAIADVSGKGVQAALLMANLQAFIKSLCKQNFPLDVASNMLNDLVSENTTLGNFITFFWGVLDDKLKTFTYVNAGHNPPLLIKNGKLDKLKKGGMLLGVVPSKIKYELETRALEKDDCIIMFTDGITEAMDVDKNEFTDERLEMLAINNYKHSAKEILEIIKNEITEHTKGAEQSDDITAVIIKTK